MKVRIGTHTELGITAERNYQNEDTHFAILGFGWEWVRECYLYLSIYFLVWRIELYTDYQDVEDKWGYTELDAMADVASEVKKAFHKLKIVKDK